MSAELDSMRQIASALDSLQDAYVRQRVVQSPGDRYGAAIAAVVQAPVTVPFVATAPNLAVEELEAPFAATSPIAPSAVPAAARPGVESTINDFATDFRRFALKWPGA